MCKDCKVEVDMPKMTSPSFSRPDSPKVEREREIPAAINILEHKLETLDRSVTMLTEKLAPIVNMKCGIADKNKSIADLVPTSPMGEKLVSLANYVSTIQNRITELRDVVEV